MSHSLDILKILANFLLDPFNIIGLTFFLTLLGFLFKKRIGFVFGALLTVAIIFFSSQWSLLLTLKPLESVYNRPHELLPRQAVVILAGGTVKYDEKNGLFVWQESSPRLLEGIRLYLKSASRYLVLSGASPDEGDQLMAESPSMAIFAKELGISEDRVIVENESKTTQEHPEKLKSLFTKYGIDSFYLVTASSHMPRAMMVFKKAGFHPEPYPIQPLGLYANAMFSRNYLNHHRLALHEWAGLLFYMF